MYSGGWKSFWTALWTTLLVLTPLVGGTVLLGGYQARQRVRAAESQSGVPIAQPKAEDQMTLLVCVAGEKPGFVLVYLNADQNSLNLLALPSQLSVPFGEGETTRIVVSDVTSNAFQRQPGIKHSPSTFRCM